MPSHGQEKPSLPDAGAREVMTLGEVADYLQLAERTVLRMAQRGEIPAAKIASQWRFIRSVIRDWLAGQMQTIPEPELAELAGADQSALGLKEVFRPELMNLRVRPGPKEQVLKQLVKALARSGFARDPQRLLNGLVERERMMTTAVGHGVALPHPRKPLSGMFPEPAVALGLCREGTNFEAIDDRLVHVFFLICATREGIHLQLMAKISWLTRQAETLDQLRRAASADEAANVIAGAQGALGPAGK